MLWIYHFPNWLLCVMTLTVFVGVSLLGLVLLRPWIERHLFGAQEFHNDAVSAFIGSYGVFYGITLGLIAVATWENYEAADDVVDKEASALAALYRDVSAFPEPARTELRNRLRRYLDFVIERAWKEHRLGRIPAEGMKLATLFESYLVSFNPTTQREVVIFHETLDQFNHMIELRQSRLDAVEQGLPEMLWWVVLIGAVLNVGMTYLIRAEPPRTHLLLTGLLAAFIGLMVFLIAALDHPFQGEFSIEPDAFVHVRESWDAADQPEVSPPSKPPS